MKTREELAAVFGVHATTIRNWEEVLGICQFRKDSWKGLKRTVFYEDEVIEFIQKKFQEKRGK